MRGWQHGGKDLRPRRRWKVSSGANKGKKEQETKE